MSGAIANRLGLALVVVCFCAPLFVGLGRGDLVGDEAGHSFSVDRMLESGDWLVPKASPQEDQPFLEKPPLKFWIVALPIHMGLLPHNEFGLRFWDALFGSLAFLYVYAIGCRLAGAVCGVVSVLTLFVFWPLLFDHGLRTNNMEAALLLCYCGGTYHYLRWTLSARAAPGRADVVATILYFVLGFMTKFVAALFLPLVLGVATLAVQPYREKLLRDWRAWAAGSALGVGLIAPWFLYAFHRFGSELPEIMLASQVYTRMTSFLDPSQVQPWSYYWASLYKSFSYAGAIVLVMGGVLALIAQTIRRRWAEGLVVLLWFALPLCLISIGSSKLIHYAYPFVPPLALAAGYLAALIVMVAPAPIARIAWPRVLLVTVAAGAAVLAIATLRSGEIRFDLGGSIGFRNASVFRPAMLALLAAVLASGIRQAPRLAALLLVAIILPVPAYAQNLARLDDGEAPLRTLRDCLLSVEAPMAAPSPGMYVDVPDAQMSHPVYYYFRRVRPWTRAQSLEPVRIEHSLDDPAEFRPVLIARSEYRELIPKLTGNAALQHAGAPPSVVALGDFDALMLLPGPYAACGADPSQSGRAR